MLKIIAADMGQLHNHFCQIGIKTMSSEAKEDFSRVFQSFDTAMLITIGAGGRLEARPMFIAKQQSIGELVFVTSSQSCKLEEIESNPEVCVTVSAPGKYAFISGKAEILRDAALVSIVWNDAWRQWFPAGQDDDKLVLIKVHGTVGESWTDSHPASNKYWYDKASAAWSGEAPDGAELSAHARVQF